MSLGAEYYQSLVDGYRERRELLCAALSEAGFAFTSPEGAYYVLADFSAFSDTNDRDFGLWLARECGVATVPGSSFYSAGGGRSHVRFVFCKKIETLEAAAERLLKVRSMV
jgi:aminotransferase